MERQRAVLVVFLILFFFFSPDTTQPSRGQRKRLEDRVSKEYEALQRLRNSSFDQYPTTHLAEQNATGTTDVDDLLRSLRPSILQRARAQYLQLFAHPDQVGEDGTVAGNEASYVAALQHPPPFFQNVSGTLHGDFARHPLSANLHADANRTISVSGRRGSDRDYSKNITEADGQLRFRISEEEKDAAVGDSAREIIADVAIQTRSSPGSGWEIKTFGVHYPTTGSIILTTTSEKFPGIFTLPYFARSNTEFSQAQQLLNHSLSEILSDRDPNADDRVSPLSSISADEGTSIFSSPSCEFIIYLQQQAVQLKDVDMDSNRVMQLVKSIEDELRFPKGVPIPEVPPMIFTALVFSPDCGFLLESAPNPDPTKSHFLSGPKKELLGALTRQLLFALVITFGLQISLLKRQMDEASTPSTRSRTSYYSIAMMAMGDGLMLTTLIAFSLLNDADFLILTAAGFLCFFNFAFFEMKFIYEIWLVQVGDSRRDESQETRIDSPPQPSNENAGQTPGLPVPVTAPQPTDTGATPIILPPDQDIETAAEEDGQAGAATRGRTTATQNRIDFQTLYSRFWFIMLVLGFFSIWASSWPKWVRSTYINLLCFLYLSFWVPQIYRNIIRNSRQAFTWEYVIGISVLRLLPVMYCYTKQSNTLSFDTDPLAGFTLAAWLSLQVLALAVQQFLGPRLFVKESWCPPAYDYHPLLQTEDGDVESGSLLPIGFVASASEAKDVEDSKGKELERNFKAFDCAICMNEIQVPVVQRKEAADNSHYGAGLLGRRTYMVTPCRHIFHTQCLEGWMRLKLVCPICRESLPPL